MKKTLLTVLVSAVVALYISVKPAANQELSEAEKIQKTVSSLAIHFGESEAVAGCDKSKAQKNCCAAYCKSKDARAFSQCAAKSGCRVNAQRSTAGAYCIGKC